jgi:hypothetical protein
MTITNFSATIQGASVLLSCDSTEDYCFFYADAETVSDTPSIGVTSISIPYVSGAVYQAVDSATQSPVPAPLEPMPPRYIVIEWDESSEPDLAQYEIKLNDATVQFQTAGSPSYTYRTPRLESGEMSIVVIAIDQDGNALSTVSELTYYIEDVPPPVRGIELSQTGAGNLSLEITSPPIGW